MTQLSSLNDTDSPRAQATLEIALITAMMFVLGSGIPPAVNEAHYLAKARHFWDPAWCPTDPFLQSADAHLSFYWVFGWVAQLASFTAAAWIGRLVAWMLLAVAWQRLSWSLVPVRLVSILTCGLWLMLVDRGHMSGEWIIGGVEAKVFAYPCVIAGLVAMTQGRWRSCWIWFGAASALHVLVGGWAVVTAFFSWLLEPSNRKPPLRSMIPGLLAGGLLSLAGLVPAIQLSMNATPELRDLAAQTYVFERLSHHLQLRSFDPVLILRHIAMIGLFFALSWSLRTEPRFRPVWSFIVGSIGLAAIGSLVDLLAGTTIIGAKILRYYWFRPSDVFVPMGIALVTALWWLRLRSSRPQWSAYAICGLVALLVVSIGETSWRIGQNRVPAADRQGGIRDTSQWEQWKDVADWCTEHLPEDAIVLTPPDHQTFRWYSDRSEWVNWKDIPQDAQAISEWRQRRQLIDRLRQLVDEGRYQEANDAFQKIARQSGCKYVILRTPTMMPLDGFRPVYQNLNYLVLQAHDAS